PPAGPQLAPPPRRLAAPPPAALPPGMAERLLPIAEHQTFSHGREDLGLPRSRGVHAERWLGSRQPGAGDQRGMTKAPGSRGGGSGGGAAGWPTPTAPMGSQPGGRPSAARVVSRQNMVLDTQHEPRPSTARATRRFCTAAPMATTNISRSDALRRWSG